MTFNIKHYQGRPCKACEKGNTWRRPFHRWEVTSTTFAAWQCSACGYCTDDEGAATETPNPTRTVRVIF